MAWGSLSGDVGAKLHPHLPDSSVGAVAFFDRSDNTWIKP